MDYKYENRVVKSIPRMEFISQSGFAELSPQLLKLHERNVNSELFQKSQKKEKKIGVQKRNKKNVNRRKTEQKTKKESSTTHSRVYPPCPFLNKVTREDYTKMGDIEKYLKPVDKKDGGYKNRIYGQVCQVNKVFKSRLDCCRMKVHSQPQSGIDGASGKFASPSIVANQGNHYSGTKDFGKVVYYVGQGTGNQKMEKYNLSLKKNLDLKVPIRFVRGYNLKSKYSPSGKKYIYSGLYWVTAIYREKKQFVFKLCRAKRQEKLYISKEYVGKERKKVSGVKRKLDEDEPYASSSTSSSEEEEDKVEVGICNPRKRAKFDRKKFVGKIGNSMIAASTMEVNTAKNSNFNTSLGRTHLGNENNFFSVFQKTPYDSLKEELSMETKFLSPEKKYKRNPFEQQNNYDSVSLEKEWEDF